MNLSKEQTIIKEKLDTLLKSSKIPHLLLYGDSGTGKRTLLQYLINEIYKDITNKNEYMITINCSEFKGIKFIREDLKFFGKKQIFNYNNKIFKSIILYNSEFLTIDAQSSLRRLIEIYSKNTRFFMITNNIHKIITPILSRFCVIYVPCTVIKNKCINYYEYNNEKMINLSKFDNQERKMIANKLNNIQNIEKNSDLLNIAQYLYKKSINIDNLIYVIKKELKKENNFEKIQKFNNNEFKLHYLYKEIKNDTFLIYIILCFFRFNYDFSI